MTTDTKKRDPEDVRKMFARVSRAYDAANRAMCFGLDILWRKRLVRTMLNRAGNCAEPTFLDAACGSGDVALQTAKDAPDAKIIGADFCEEMLEIAQKKANAANLEKNIEFTRADCSQTPFADASFDGATISFGFRNFSDRPACLREFFRILKPSAALAILEVSRASGFFAASQKIFMCNVVPFIAGLCGGERDDYKYLAKTTMEYPSDAEVAKMLTDAGFKDVKIRKMAFGLVAITSAVK